MKISDKIDCPGFSCDDVDKKSYILPSVEIDAAKVKIVMITEAPPLDRSDYFYAAGEPFYLRTTLEAFRQAGAKVDTIKGILDLGVYITTAIKCAKTALTISPETMKNCSSLLEKEVALFPNVKAFFLGGRRSYQDDERNLEETNGGKSDTGRFHL